MDITKGIRHIEHEHGKTWIWLNTDKKQPRYKNIKMLNGDLL